MIALFLLSLARKFLIVAFVFIAIPGMADPKQTGCSPIGDPIGGSGHHCKW